MKSTIASNCVIDIIDGLPRLQRHNNVSILYADIVNFTPLSETLSAHQLVLTLNQLFGKFDQLAQVKCSTNL
jgi:class 3 adenylate cyclase